MFFSIHHYLFFRLGSIFNTIIVCLNPNSLGNAVEEIRFSLIKAQKENKKIIFFFCKFSKFFTKQKIVDDNLIKLTDKYTSVAHNSFLYHVISLFFCKIFFVEKFFFSIFNKLYKKIPNGYYYRPMIGQDIIWRPDPNTLKYNFKLLKKNSWNKDINKFEFKIPKKIDEEYKKNLEKIGLPKNSWFVCLHCRSADYRGDLDNPFNINIETYYPTIKYITEKKGGYVVILGDEEFKDVNLFKNVINYPKSKFKSLIMDFIIIKYSLFYIGGGSGPTDIAIIQKKKYLLTNMQSWIYGLGRYNNSITLLKHAYSISQKRFLSIREMLSSKYKISESKDGWNCKDWIMHSNSKEEILAAAKEMFLRKTKITKLQKKFKEKIKKSYFNAVTYFKFDSENELENVNYWYRMSKTNNWFNLKGNLSETFLKKNWNKKHIK
jgi:putative glycosyltransferase (TIGR04372 family)